MAASVAVIFKAGKEYLDLLIFKKSMLERLRTQHRHIRFGCHLNTPSRQPGQLRTVPPQLLRNILTACQLRRLGPRQLASLK